MYEKIEKIKTHLKENKTVYLACAGTAVVAVVGTVLVMSTRNVNGVPPLIKSSLNWRPRNEVISTTIHLVERSTPSKPVHLVGTNLYFSSLNEAARETGHSLSKISKHVNGHIPDLNGDVFEVLESAS